MEMIQYALDNLWSLIDQMFQSCNLKSRFTHDPIWYINVSNSTTYPNLTMTSYINEIDLNDQTRPQINETMLISLPATVDDMIGNAFDWKFKFIKLNLKELIENVYNWLFTSLNECKKGQLTLAKQQNPKKSLSMKSHKINIDKGKQVKKTIELSKDIFFYFFSAIQYYLRGGWSKDLHEKIGSFCQEELHEDTKTKAQQVLDFYLQMLKLPTKTQNEPFKG